MTDLTDPAKELGTVGRWMRQLSANMDEAAWQALARGWGVDTAGPELLDLLAAIRQRIARLTDLGDRLEDPDFDDDLRGELHNALGRFAAGFQIHSLTHRWVDYLNNWVKVEDVRTITWFSQIARKQRPLRKITQEERDELLAELDAVLSGLPGEIDLEGWHRAALLEGLHRFRLILQHLDFFGHEAASGHLIVVARATHEAVLGDPNNPGLRSAWTFLAHAAMALTIVAAPDQAITALGHYKELLGKGIDSNNAWLIGGPVNPARTPPFDEPLPVLPSPPRTKRKGTR